MDLHLHLQVHMVIQHLRQLRITLPLSQLLPMEAQKTALITHPQLRVNPLIPTLDLF